VQPRHKLYHGGVPGLTLGQKLQPPSITGMRSCSEYDNDHCRPDRVYLTTDVAEAAVYAALAPPGGRGDVYEAEPEGELEPDASGELGTAYAAPTATVVAVLRRAVSLEEAAVRMIALLLTTEPAQCGGDSESAVRYDGGH